MDGRKTVTRSLPIDIWIDIVKALYASTLENAAGTRVLASLLKALSNTRWQRPIS
jgi:hypothetical protein